MRFKNRYMLLEISSLKKPEYLIENKINFLGVIKEHLLKYYGILGYAKIFSSLKIIYFNLKANFIVVRVSRNYFVTFKNSIFLLRRFRECEIRIKLLFVTGTIKKMEEKLFLEFKKSKNKEIYKIANELKNLVD